MIYKLKTSKQTMEILKDLQTKTNLTPNILSRLAISLSLTDECSVDTFDSDNNGLEFNRPTLTSHFDIVYKTLISQHCKRSLTDEEYFPTYLKKHLDRGALMLESEYKYTGNYEKFIIHLARLTKELVL